MDPQRHFEAKARELAEAVDCGDSKRAAAVLLTDYNSQEAMMLIRSERSREQARGSHVHLDVDADGALVFRGGNGYGGVFAGKVDPRQFANACPRETPMPPGPPQRFAMPNDMGTWNNQGAMPPEALYPGAGSYGQGGWNEGSSFQQTLPWQFNQQQPESQFRQTVPWQYNPQPVAPPYYGQNEGVAIAGTALAALAIGLTVGNRGHMGGWQPLPRYRFHR